MPQWAETLGWIAGALVAAGIVWTKLVRPLLRFASLAERMVPLLVDLTKQFEDAPGAFAVLDEVAAQFRTNSGSSLRDVVNRLEATSDRIDGRAKTLELRDEEDRTTVARLAAVVNALAARVDLNTRIAEASQIVAVEGRASIQSSVDRLATPATTSQEPATPAAAPDVLAGGVGVGDKLVVKVEDVVKEPT